MHTQNYFKEVSEIAALTSFVEIEQLATELAQLREHEGRLYLLGVALQIVVTL